MTARFLASAGEFLLDLAALVWPTSCVVCDAADRDLCESCRAALRSQRDRVIDTRAPTGVRVCAAHGYENPVKAPLLALKHQGMTGFARPLAERLRAPLVRVTSGVPPGGRVLLVAAPSRRSRVRERGYQHVELLIRAVLRDVRADAAIANASFRALPGALRSVRGRTAQVGLSARERQENAARVSVIRRARLPLFGARVVLVDDVVTTGATVSAASEALAAAGAHVLGVVSLCLVQRRDARREEHSNP